MSAADEKDSAAPSPEQIQQWIVVNMARLLRVQPEEIDPHIPLARHGLDSVQVVLLATDLEQWLGIRFTSNPLDEQATIETLSLRLAALTNPARPADNRTS